MEVNGTLASDMTCVNGTFHTRLRAALHTLADFLSALPSAVFTPKAWQKISPGEPIRR